jgi:hypothetical protein
MNYMLITDAATEMAETQVELKAIHAKINPYRDFYATLFPSTQQKDHKN